MGAHAFCLGCTGDYRSGSGRPWITAPCQCVARVFRTQRPPTSTADGVYRGPACKPIPCPPSRPNLQTQCLLHNPQCYIRTIVGSAMVEAAMAEVAMVKAATAKVGMVATDTVARPTVEGPARRRTSQCQVRRVARGTPWRTDLAGARQRRSPRVSHSPAGRAAVAREARYTGHRK